MSLRKRISELSRESNDVVIEEIEEHKLDEIMEDLNNKADDLNKEYNVSEEITIITSNIEEVQGGIQATLDNSSDISDVDVAVAEAHLQQIAIRCGFADSLTCESIEYFKDGVRETLSLESYNYANDNREKLEQIALALEGIGASIKKGIAWVFKKLFQFFMAIANFFRYILSPTYRAYKWVLANEAKVKEALAVQLDIIAFGNRNIQEEAERKNMPKDMENRIKAENNIIKHLAKFASSLSVVSLDLIDSNTGTDIIKDVNKSLKKVKDAQTLANELKSFSDYINNKSKTLEKEIKEGKTTDPTIDDMAEELAKKLDKTGFGKAKDLADILRDYKGEVSDLTSLTTDKEVDVYEELVKYIKESLKDKNTRDKIVDNIFMVSTRAYSLTPIKPLVLLSEGLSKVCQGLFAALTYIVGKNGRIDKLRYIFKVISSICNAFRKFLNVNGTIIKYLRTIADVNNIGTSPRPEEPNEVDAGIDEAIKDL